eukprot:446160-Prorocentrum_minimum.AAC.1
MGQSTSRTHLKAYYTQCSLNAIHSACPGPDGGYFASVCKRPAPVGESAAPVGESAAAVGESAAECNCRVLGGAVSGGGAGELHSGPLVAL